MSNTYPPPFDNPLVSILIPPHNRPEYFRQALASALAQTYQNLEIIVSDDSADDRTETLVRETVHDPRVTYVHHKNFKMPQNITWLLTQFHGDYFQLLMDDDLIAPEKIETMLDCYRACPTATLVTSYRQLIDSNGNTLPDIRETQRIANEPTLFKGAAVRRRLLEDELNFLGEPSTVLLKRDCQADMLKIWSTYHANADLVTWMHLCTHGDVVYLPQPLNFFRHHEGQDQKDHHILFEGYCEWCHIYLDAIAQETDDAQKRVYWKRYFMNMNGLVAILLPTLRASLLAGGDTFAAHEQVLSVEGAVARVQRHFERVAFFTKNLA